MHNGNGKRRLALLLALLLTGALWLRVGLLYVGRELMETAAAATELPVLIDPGHGGEDSGAVAADGTFEKDINLAVSLSLRDLLRMFGVPVRMTRETDISIYDPTAIAARGKKVSDMQQRLALYEQAALVISVHQNHFSQPQYSGAQMFYSVNRPESRALAERLRDAVRSLLQPENKRESKPAGENIYLLDHTTVPAVLVECGFLSNEAERNRLKTEAYQQQMALTIAVGFLKFEE